MRSRPFGTYSELIDYYAAHKATDVALRADNKTVCYGELKSRVASIAEAIVQLSGTSRPTIALSATNCIDYCITILAGMWLGATLVPFPTWLGTTALRELVDKSSADMLLADAATLRRFLKTHPGIPILATEQSDDNYDIPWAYNNFNGELRWDTPSSDDLLWINFTSGTTGFPKAVPRTYGQEWQEIRARLGRQPQAIRLVATPLYSRFTQGGVLPALASGGQVIIMKVFEARAFLELFAQYGVTETTLTPDQIRSVLDDAIFDREDIRTSQRLFTGSTPMGLELKRRVVANWPGLFIEAYASSEGAASTILVANWHPSKLHTVGRPAPGCKILVLDQSDRILEPGHPGEIVGRNPTSMMSGYLYSTTATQSVEWLNHSGLRYLRTGDLGYLDDHGYLILCGRRNDAVTHTESNKYGPDIEMVLESHPEVVEAVVITEKIDGCELGLVAFAVRAGQNAITESALLQWVNCRIGKLPLTRVHFLSFLPRDSQGKLARDKLRQFTN